LQQNKVLWIIYYLATLNKQIPKIVILFYLLNRIKMEI